MDRFSSIPTMAVVLVALATPAAQAASISFVDVFKNVAYTQTGNGNTLTANGAFYSADLNTSVPNAYTSATMTFPGPSSPLNLTQISPTDYNYQSAGFATQAAMDAAFPLGTYTFTGLNVAVNDTASFQYTADDYAQSLPYLIGTDFTSAQGMNAAQAFTFHFSPFVTGSTASSSFIFFNIFDTTTNSYAYLSGFLGAGSTSLTLAANTLTAGHIYQYELDFSNRDSLASPGADFTAAPSFDVRTAGTFTAAAASVPEPSSFALVGLPLLLAGLVARKRKIGTA